MQNLASVVVLIISLSSCTSYQYVCLKSDLDQTSDLQNYYYQDENVYIDFNFKGTDFPMHIYLENIGSKPLYLDMEKTLLLENDVILQNAFPSTRGSILTFVYDGEQESRVVVTDENPNILYIPEGEKITMQYNVFKFPYNELAKQKSVAKKIKFKGYNYKFNAFDYSRSSAPNYEISFYFASDPTSDSGYDVICVFWPETIYSQKRAPSNFPLEGPNMFHTSQFNPAPAALGYISLVGIATIAGAFMTEYEDQD